MAIVLISLLYYTPNFRFNKSDNSSDVIARVYGRDVLKQDLDLMMSNQMAQFGKNADLKPILPLLVKRSMDKLVQDKIVEELAKRKGIVVSDSEIKYVFESMLRQAGFVGEDNKLLSSDEINKRLLAHNYLSLKALETKITSELTMNRLFQQTAMQIPVDNEWVNLENRVQNEKVGFESVTISPNFASIEDPGTQKLETFLKEHSGRFQVGPRRIIDYVSITPNNIQLPVADDNAMKAVYNSNKAQFTELHASHILFKIENNSELQKTLQKAQAIKSKLLSGQDFYKVAKIISQDPSVIQNKGDLGWFPLGKMDKKFEQAAMNLKVGEISEPVRTDFGIHLIRLEGRREKSFDQVKNELRSKFIKDYFTNKAKEQLDQLRKRTGDNGELSTASKSIGLKCYTSNPLIKDKTYNLEGLSNSQDLIVRVFQAKPGKVSETIETQDGYIVFRVKKELPIAVPPLSEIRDIVLEAWQIENARSAAMLKVSNAIKFGSLKDVGNPVIQEPIFIANLGELSGHPAIRKALLNTPVGELTPILWTPSGKLWVARIKSRIPAKPLSFVERKRIVEQIQSKEAEELLAAEAQHLKQVGDKHSGLSSLYGRINGIWFNEKEISNYTNN